MTIRFTDARLVGLSAASQRVDWCITPTPQLRGVVATKFAEKMLTAGFALEILASKDMPVWRRDDDGGAIALRRTAGGLAAIGVADESAPAADDETEADIRAGVSTNDEGESGRSEAAGFESASAADRSPFGDDDSSGAPSEAPSRAKAPADPRGSAKAHSEPKADAPRSGTKLATLIAMLARAEGATIDEPASSFGWLPHTVRAAITGLRKRDYAVSPDKTDKTRGSVYRIGDSGAEAVVHGENVRDANAGETSDAIPEPSGRDDALPSDAMVRDGVQ